MARREFTVQWRKYLSDYVLTLAFLIVGFVSNAFPSFHRVIPNFTSHGVTPAEIQSWDTHIGFPLEADIVPYWAACFMCLVPSLLVGGLFAWRTRRWNDFHHNCLGLAATFALTWILTNVAKKVAGRPRPDYLARCDPVLDADTNLLKCTGKESVVDQGLVSFPSGHSSTAFCGGTYLTLWLLGKMRVYACGQSGNRQLWKLSVASLPMWWAAFVAISRTMDYHHNFSDILAGSILGAVVAKVVYPLYYPSLDSKSPDEPILRNDDKADNDHPNAPLL